MIGLKKICQARKGENDEHPRMHDKNEAGDAGAL
jgi:hypothetical protein